MHYGFTIGVYCAHRSLLRRMAAGVAPPVSPLDARPPAGSGQASGALGTGGAAVWSGGGGASARGSGGRVGGAASAGAEAPESCDPAGGRAGELAAGGHSTDANPAERAAPGTEPTAVTLAAAWLAEAAVPADAAAAAVDELALVAGGGCPGAPEAGDGTLCCRRPVAAGLTAAGAIERAAAGGAGTPLSVASTRLLLDSVASALGTRLGTPDG